MQSTFKKLNHFMKFILIILCRLYINIIHITIISAGGIRGAVNVMKKEHTL